MLKRLHLLRRSTENRVGDGTVVPGESPCVEALIEDLARFTYEWRTGEYLVLAWAFPDDDETGAGVDATHDGSRLHAE